MGSQKLREICVQISVVSGVVTPFKKNENSLECHWKSWIEQLLLPKRNKTVYFSSEFLLGLCLEPGHLVCGMLSILSNPPGLVQLAHRAREVSFQLSHRARAWKHSVL